MTIKSWAPSEGGAVKNQGWTFRRDHLRWNRLSALVRLSDH